MENLKTRIANTNAQFRLFRKEQKTYNEWNSKVKVLLEEYLVPLRRTFQDHLIEIYSWTVIGDEPKIEIYEIQRVPIDYGDEEYWKSYYYWNKDVGWFVDENQGDATVHTIHKTKCPVDEDKLLDLTAKITNDLGVPCVWHNTYIKDTPINLSTFNDIRLVHGYHTTLMASGEIWYLGSEFNNKWMIIKTPEHVLHVYWDNGAPWDADLKHMGPGDEEQLLEFFDFCDKCRDNNPTVPTREEWLDKIKDSWK